MLNENWHKQVNHFWFEELTPKDWYQSTSELDESIKVQFGPLINHLEHIEPTALTQSPEHLLAAIITLDQFPRNSFRGTSKAFAYDNAALAMSKHAVSQGFDQSMNQSEKQFCYMPFMHAERLDMQEKCVDLFAQLGSENGLKHAQEHRDIVEQYGRFPHRNDVLGRQSTPEEQHFLTTARRFGQ